MQFFLLPLYQSVVCIARLCAVSRYYCAVHSSSSKVSISTGSCLLSTIESHSAGCGKFSFVIGASHKEDFKAKTTIPLFIGHGESARIAFLSFCPISFGNSGEKSSHIFDLFSGRTAITKKPLDGYAFS